MVRYNFTLAVTRNTKKIAANELDLLLVLVRLLHNRKHKAASKPERPGIPASACACRQKQLLYRIVYSRRFLFLCWCRIHTKRKTWISAVACVPSKRLLLWWIKYWTNCLYRLTYLSYSESRRKWRWQFWKQDGCAMPLVCYTCGKLSTGVKTATNFSCPSVSM